MPALAAAVRTSMSPKPSMRPRIDWRSTTSVSFSRDESDTVLLTTPVTSTTRRLVSAYTFIRQEMNPQTMRNTGTSRTTNSQFVQEPWNHVLKSTSSTMMMPAATIHLIISAIGKIQWWRSV